MKKFGFGLMRLPTKGEYTKIDLAHFQKIHVDETMVKKGLLQRLICTLVKIFAPML